jgi:hypothetical protein
LNDDHSKDISCIFWKYLNDKRTESSSNRAFAGRFGHCRRRARQNHPSAGDARLAAAPMPHGHGPTDFLYQRDGEIIGDLI